MQTVGGGARDLQKIAKALEGGDDPPVLAFREHDPSSARA